MSVSQKKLFLVLGGAVIFLGLVFGAYVLGARKSDQASQVEVSPVPVLGATASAAMEPEVTPVLTITTTPSPSPSSSPLPSSTPTPTPTAAPTPEPTPTAGGMVEYNPNIQMRPEEIYVLPSATPLPTPLPTIHIEMPKIEIPWF